MKEKMKILLIEDTPADAELVKRELKKGKINSEMLVVDSKTKFEKALGDFAPDIILSDHSLPDFDSHEALRMLKATGSTIPFILITATMTDEFAVQTMKEGAVDYIIKDRLNRLPSAVANSVESHRLKEEEKATHQLLADNEKKFHHVLNNMMEGAQIHDFEWRYLYVNDALVSYSAYTREELMGFTVMEKYPGIEQTELFKTMQRCMTDRTGEKFETEFVFPDGTKKDFELSIEPIPEGIFILSVDHSEKKRAKEKLMKANRLYAFLSAINQSIVHTTDEQMLLNNACNIAVGVGQFLMGWIGMIDEETAMLNTVSHQGTIASILETKKNSGMDYTSALLRDTPTGRVLSTGKYAVSNDVENDPALRLWLKELAANGIRSTISLPITKFGKVVGIFGFHSSKANFFDAEEIALLDEAANDVSYALEIFEETRKHKATEELVVQNEKRFRAMIEKSADMITLANATGELLYASPSVAKVLGYTIEEFLNSPATGIIHPEDIPGVFENVGQILQAEGKSFYSQHRLKHKSGKWIWCEGTITNMLHEEGVHALVSNFRDISERKNAEEKLTNNEKRFRALIENSADMISLTSPEGQILYASPAASKLLGYTTEEFKNLQVSDFIHPDDHITPEQLTVLFNAPGNSVSLQQRMLQKNGAWMFVEGTLANMLHEPGVNALVSNFRDISERKNAEEKLTNNERRFRALVENGADGVIILNAEGKPIYASPTLKKVLGYTEEELMKIDMFSLVHTDDVAGGVNVMQQVMANPGIPIPGKTARMLHKDGTWRWIAATVTNMLHDTAINGIVDNFHDVTEKIKAEEQKEFDTTNTNALINNTHDLMWSVDTDFNLITANEPFNEMSHVNFGRVVEKGSNILSTAYTPEMRDHFKLQYERAFAGEAFTETEYFTVPYEFWTEVSYYPIRKGDEIIGTACQSRDISKIKKQEKELILSNTELEQFAYVASHDLQEPLRMVTSFLTQLEKKYGNVMDDKGKQYIHFAVDGAKRMRHIILDLLEFSRVGTTDNKKEMLDLNEMVDEIKILLRKKIKEKKAIILTDKLPSVNGYRTPLLQIFQNLIGNALKYSKEDSAPQIQITAKEETTQWQISVTDNGIGINKEYFDKIFIIFQRLHNKDEYSGTGIGLAITKKIIEAQGGRIWIESEEGKGSTFYFTLPKN